MPYVSTSIGKTGRALKPVLLATTCLVSVICCADIAKAGPSGASVVGGQVSISNPNAQTTVVTQSTQRGIINWNSFSLGSSENLIFRQQGSSSVTLNRVTGPNASSLDGSIQANGQVWIINSNGVFFGPNAQVSVAGLLVSTTDIKNSNFMAGNYVFDGPSGNPNASIINQGRLQAADGGYVVLSAPHVDNQGVIEARLGHVVLAGAKTFTVDFAGDGLLSFAIDTPVDQMPKDANGNPVGWLVSNSGTLGADGGQVLMTARAAGNVLDHLINTSGIIEARGVSLHNGTVTLDSGDGGIDVSGNIDVTGANGGGTITVGSKQASSVVIEKTAVLDASATGNGNGGAITVVSGGTTTVAGTLISQGGAQGGDGGQVETSGQTLNIGGATVNTGTTKGKSGTWLLDPYDLTIDTAAAASIDTALNNGSNVSLQTTTDGATAGYGGTVNSAGNGDIMIAAAITWSSSSTLTLNAYHSVLVNADITASGAGSLLNITYGNGGHLLTGANASVTLPSTGGLIINNAHYQLISTAAQLQAANPSATAYFALVNDITTTGTFTTLGALTSNRVFEGLGHNINNLQINGSGLFTAIDGPALVENLHLVNGSLNGGDNSTNSGLLAGVNHGLILNSSASGTATSGSGAQGLGGLVGYNDGTIASSYASVVVNGGIDAQYVGGLVGKSDSGGLILSSYAVGDVSGADGAANLGGLAGYNGGQIVSSYATGSVIGGSGSYNIGGLVGWNSAADTAAVTGTIIGSYATGAVSGGSGSYNIGGLAGVNYVTIVDSYATGVVTGGDWASNVGGLVGQNASIGYDNNSLTTVGTVLSSHASGAVNAGYSASSVGGLVGDNQSVIETSYATGSVLGGDFAYAIGGLVGYNENGGLVSYSYASGAVGGGSGANAIGGLVGWNASGIAFSYATGSVTGGIDASYLGGLVGLNNGSSSVATILSSYATGEVSGDAGAFYLGGLVGVNNLGTVSGSFWDADTTGQTWGCGDDSACSGGANAVYSTNGSSAFTKSVYTAAGWSFANTAGDGGVWYMVDGYTRPILASEYSTTITNAHQLELVNLDLNAHYTLANNIDMSEATQASGVWNKVTGFVPIAFNATSNIINNNNNNGIIINTDGDNNGGNGGVVFGGTIDGQGHTVNNLFIYNPLASYLGLIADIGSGGVVQNLGLVGGSVTGGNNVSNIGMLAGQNSGTIVSSYATGTVSAGGDASNIGGLVGYNNNFILSSYATGAVSGSDGSFSIGGLVGYNDGSISSSHATGAVSGGGNASNIGGLVGSNSNFILSSYATGTVSGDDGSSSIGGLVGSSYGSLSSGYATILSSYATGAVSGGIGAEYIGGLVGWNGSGALISSSYATGAVNGGAASQNTGGLVGQNDQSTILSSYASGVVTGADDAVNLGGLVGANNGTISDTYAVGAVNSGSGAGSLGGLVGFNAGAITDSYATGAVNAGANTQYIGGLVGYNAGTISLSYSIGAVATPSGGSLIGGLVGVNVSGTVTDSYWDKTTSGQTNSAGGTGLATADWMTQGPAADSAWTTSPHWIFSAGSPYPLLSALPFIAIDVASLRKTYGQVDPTLSATVTGGTGDQDAALLAALCLSTTATTSSSVGTYGINVTLGNAVPAGYQLEIIAGTLTIDPKVLTVSGLTAAPSKVYDGTTKATVSGTGTVTTGTAAVGEGSATDGLIYAGDTVTLIGTATGTYNSANVGTATKVTFGGYTSSNANYVLSFGSQAATITAAPVTPAPVTSAPTPPAISSSTPAVQQAIQSVIASTTVTSTPTTTAPAASGDTGSTPSSAVAAPPSTPAAAPPVPVDSTATPPMSSVENTDTGGAMFSAISPSSGGTDAPAGGSSAPSSNAKPSSSKSDTSDRALSVVAQPPPVTTVSHQQPLPPKVKQPLVPGLVDRVQTPNVAPTGVPGLNVNYSQSGNTGQW